MEMHNLSLKAQEGYHCSHSCKSAGEAHNPYKVCAGWLEVHNLAIKRRFEGLLLQKGAQI
jgi:hypothetical protein